MGVLYHSASPEDAPDTRETQALSRIRDLAKPGCWFKTRAMMYFLLPVMLFFAALNAAMVGAEEIRARLLPGWRGENGVHVAGLELELADGWKTYWRAPGDAGIPPEFHWNGSGNLEDVSVVWPAPVVFEQNGMRSIGYARKVVLPLTIAPRDAGSPILLEGEVSLGVCKDICVPKTLRLSAQLPVARRKDARILGALAARPFGAEQAGVREVSCRLVPEGRGLRLEAAFTLARSGGGPEALVVEAGNPRIWVSEPELTREGDRLKAVAHLQHATRKSFAVSRNALRLTLLSSDGGAIEINGCPAPRG